MFTHDFIWIDTPFRYQLQRARLDSVTNVLACVGDRLAAWSRTSDTIWCDLPFASSSVFLKRYHYPRWNHRLRGTFRGTFFSASRARSEFHALRLMRQLGIQAVRPIAFGERRVAHFVRSCFLITEAVPDAVPLSSFIKTFGDRRDSVQACQSRREILTSLARQVRHMHDAGFVHRDLFWRNVLIRLLPDSRFEFYFLDASVGKRIRMSQRRQDSIVSDLAAMGALAPDFCSKADQMRFLLTYLDTPRLSPQDRQWLRRVQARSNLFHASEWQRLQRSYVFDPPVLASEDASGL
ncbi:MAG TPA: lipopolysaccharide kinase InaA family protein [Phycisphaerae bacterium]|nr:lipopolysaccharide kinase InaA family protein [Phycisphaerae bacterium]